MDAIITTSQTGTLYETDGVKNWIPFSSDNLDIHRKLIKNRTLWVTKSTLESFPLAVQHRWPGSFRILSTRGANNEFYQGHTTFTFDQLESVVDTLADNHILIGGHKAFKRLLPVCQNIFWLTVPESSSGGRQVTLNTSVIRDSHKYGQVLYEDDDCCYWLYSQSFEAKKEGVARFNRKLNNLKKPLEPSKANPRHPVLTRATHDGLGCPPDNQGYKS
jgi:hypothetical protein